ncbi:MAG TPA: hypothetical protein VJX72_10700 [Candidatus Acidoferrum sp.]|nr:hypothetical protein [Candidatus Acidoferrum sp.]
MVMQTLMGVRASDLKFRDATNEEVSRLVNRHRGGEQRSERGFGPRRKRNEVAPGLTSYRDGWYWDSFSVAAAAAFPVTNMFATPQGSGGKTLAQTNLTGQGGQLPSGQVLLMRYIRIYISNVTVPADFQNILTNCSVEFKVDNTPIYQALPGFFPAGFGGATLAVGNLGTLPSGTASVVSTSNGFPVQTATYEFKYPYTLESALNFTLLWTPQTAFNMVAASGVNPIGVGTSIVCVLDGEKQKIVVG